ncbi:MAG: hypothetical protein SAJ37_17865 [Oscillatoria sp. PMC 1068.18]|nr:hypothetical protein [Oscillatoria sp. PMC 1076.18]MEC4990602.1 hypothetical protein [Oscillatoria sp. PMC 1068.18]
MFILKRQDVEITSIKHPKRDQQIPILNYQGQTFRLISVFAADRAEEARAFWRDLTDNQGKFCVLLEETDRYSIWGRVNLDKLGEEAGGADFKIVPVTQASILLLQTVYFDVEDLLGNRQAKLFEKDITKVFQVWNFPLTDTPQAINELLTADPLSSLNLPPWEEHHLITLLQELYRIGKEYFGNDNFASGIEEILQDMQPTEQKQFRKWLNQTPLGKLWR